MIPNGVLSGCQERVCLSAVWRFSLGGHPSSLAVVDVICTRFDGFIFTRVRA